MILAAILGFNEISKKIFHNLSTSTFIEVVIYDERSHNYESTYCTNYNSPLDVQNILSRKNVIITTLTQKTLYDTACQSAGKLLLSWKQVENFTPEDLRNLLNRS